MAEKKDYYYQGRIYIDYVEPFVLQSYFGALADYLKKFTSYPIQTPHPFTDCQDVTGRYELRKKSPDKIIGGMLTGQPREIIESEIIAFPTHPDKVKGGKEGVEEGVCVATFKGEITKPTFLALLDYIDDMKQRGWDFITHERTDLSNGNVKINYRLQSINKL